MNDAQFEQIIGEILQEQEERGLGELEYEDEDEGLGFFHKKIKKAFKRIGKTFKKKAGSIRKVLKKVVGGAAVIVGGIYGGPAGAAAGMKAYQALNMRRKKAGLPPVVLPASPGQKQLPLNDPRYVLATQDVANQMLEGGPIQMRSPRARQAFNSYVGSESMRFNITKWAIPGAIIAAVAFIAVATRGER